MGKQGGERRDLNPIPLEPDAPLPAPAKAEPQTRPRACPKCAAVVLPGAPACQRCGQSMRPKAALAKPAEPCPHCGYDLAGGKGPKCPECGKDVSPAAIRAAKRRENAKAAARSAYLSPLLMCVVSVCVLAGIYAISGEPSVLLVHGVSLLFTLPTGLAVYFFLCMVWLGSDDSWPLTTLKLAAIYLTCDAASAAMGLTGIPIIPWLATIVLYITLLMKMLDLEQGEAIIVAGLTFAVRMFVGIGIIAVLF